MDVFTLGSSFFSPPRRPHLPSTSGTDFLEGWCLDRQGKGGIHLPHEKPGGAVHAPLWFSSRQERVSGLSHEGRGEERGPILGRSWICHVVEISPGAEVLKRGGRGEHHPLEDPLRVRSVGYPLAPSSVRHLSASSTSLVEDVLGPSAPPGWIPSLPFRTREVPLSNWVETGAVPGQSRSCRGVENGRDQGFQAKQSTPQITSTSRHTCLVQQSRTKRRWRASCGRVWAWERADWSKEACRPGKKEGTRRCAEATHGKGVPWN